MWRRSTLESSCISCFFSCSPGNASNACWPGLIGNARAAGPGVEVAVIDTPTLGDRSYLAYDGSVAIVIDPQRDIDRVLGRAAQRGIRAGPD